MSKEDKDKKIKENLDKKTSKKEENAKKNSNKKALKQDKKTKKETNKKEKKSKEKKPNKFIETLKKRWIVNTTKTTLLVVIIIACFVGITIGLKKANITPIDLTEDKIYTITDESKEKVKNIDKDVNIYFVGYSDTDTTIDLAKQYSKVNDKIKVEVVTADSRPDLVQKYGIQSGSEGIIVECGEKYKVLSSNDLYTMDATTYEQINIAEEKFTYAIESVTTEKVPNVYFLTGYQTSYSQTSGMSYLNMYLQNEVYEIKSVDILSTGKVPDDCDVLFISTPESDFDETTANSIIDYISKGGKILWLNAAVTAEQNLPNVNKVLAEFGVNPFEVGVIRETESDKMISGSQDVIMPQIQYAEVTQKLYNTEGVVLVNATKINMADDDTLTNLKVTKTDLIKTGEKAYFRKDFKNTQTAAQDGEATNSFTIGAQLDKVVTEANEDAGTSEVKSTLIIYGENYFVSDYPLSQGTQVPTVMYRQNKNLVFNSIAYLANREEDITARKSSGSLTFTTTDKENVIILTIITAVPLIIIAIGIIVWINRKRRK